MYVRVYSGIGASIGMSMRNTGSAGLEDYELSCLCMTSSESTVVKRQWSIIISEHGDPYGNLSVVRSLHPFYTGINTLTAKIRWYLMSTDS